MRVYQFEESPSDEAYVRGHPIKLTDTECVYYSGTHDNDTLIGWLLGEGKAEEKTLARQVLRRIYLSDAKWVIVPFQDLLGLGSKARMNTPGTSEGNWEWRMKAEDLEPETFDPDGESRKPDANKDGVKPEGYRPLLDWLRECTVESARAPARDAARSPGRSSGV